MSLKTNVLVFSVLLGAGCSGGSSGAVAGDGGGAGSGGGSDVCTAIPKADAQAILTNPITSLQDFSGVQACVFNYSGGSQGDSLQITFNPMDTDKSSYTTLSEGPADGGDNGDHPLTGVGDEAYWNEAVPGISIPSISAHKGNVTCVIQPPDPPDSTCKTVTGDNPLGYAITEADATTFAQLLGKVCNDVFAALK
ncbi:MAG TPA: hypothetical protein VH560_11880 [Polyangia bacterium]|nr:hypothetical protein [Polyangia bacterium]